MKTLTIKINLDDVQRMDDRGELNPAFITSFIEKHINQNFLGEARSSQLPFAYTFKVKDGFHKAVKLAALEADLTMSEYVRQLFQVYYYNEG